MKKLIVLVVLLALLGGGTFAQTLQGFQNAFTDFADSMAGALAVNSTIGNNWSDAYIGSFPHFGVGLGGGVVFAGKDNVQRMFQSLGQVAPDSLAKSGIPFPAAAASLKIGLPFLPFDVGIKAGFMPKPLASSLKSSSDVDFDYKNFGLQFRYALMKESFFKPDISVGLAIDYQTGNLSTPIKSGGTQSLSYADPLSNNWVLALPPPNLVLDWKSTTFDFNIQASKTLLFILTPYIGAGLTLGTSTVSGGLESSGLTVTKNGFPSNTAAFVSAYEAATGQNIDVQGTGFRYSVDGKKPVLRIYGGFSLNILVVLDFQAMVIPATKDVGGSIMARIQF